MSHHRYQEKKQCTESILNPTIVQMGFGAFVGFGVGLFVRTIRQRKKYLLGTSAYLISQGFLLTEAGKELNPEFTLIENEVERGAAQTLNSLGINLTQNSNNTQDELILKSVTYGITKIPFLYGYVTGFSLGCGKKHNLPIAQETEKIIQKEAQQELKSNIKE